MKVIGVNFFLKHSVLWSQLNNIAECWHCEVTNKIQFSTYLLKIISLCDNLASCQANTKRPARRHVYIKLTWHNYRTNLTHNISWTKSLNNDRDEVQMWTLLLIPFDHFLAHYMQTGLSFTNSLLLSYRRFCIDLGPLRGSSSPVDLWAGEGEILSS